MISIREIIGGGVLIFICGLVAGIYYDEIYEPSRPPEPPLKYIITKGMPSEEEMDAVLEEFLWKEEQEKQIVALKKELADMKNEVEGLKRQLAKREEAGGNVAKTPGKPGQPAAPVKSDLASLTREAKADSLNRELAQRYLAEALRNSAEACEEAVELYKDAVKANPQSAHAHYNLGMAYLQLLDCMQVETSMEAAMKMGILAASAIEEFGKALEIDTNDFDALLARGITNYFFPGKMKDSVADLERLAGMAKDKNSDEKYAEGYLWLGRAYRKSGNSEKALETIREGYRHFPQNETLREMLLEMEKK
jgi:tetratricopeptide (TPR) repeat protein